MRGTVFDFDGVLVRSMENHARAYQEALRPEGVHVSKEEVLQLEGGRSESLIARFLQNAGRPAERETIVRLSKEKQRIFSTLGPPQLYEGAEDLVRSVRDKAHRMGIVTGTRRENLQRLIPQLLPLFDAVLAQDSYSHDKPHPEPYEKVAAAIGLPPSSCLVIENAPYGVQSARAAGYAWIVAITTTVSRQQLLGCGADEVVSTHAEAAQAALSFLEGGRTRSSVQSAP